MKKLVAVTLFLAAVPMAGWGQSKLTLRAGAGLASPASGDFKDAFEAGPNLVLSVGRDLGTHLSVHAELDYSRFAIDQDQIQDAIDTLGGEDGALFLQLGGRIAIDGGDTTFMGAQAALKAAILGNASTFTPYLIGAGGVTRRETSDFTVRVTILGFEDTETFDGDSVTVASAAFGGGLDFKVADTLGLFAEGRYQMVFTDSESTKYTVVRAGLSLRL